MAYVIQISGDWGRDKMATTFQTTYIVFNRAAYRFAIYIENRFLRFDRYIASEVSVSIKISKEKYFETRVTSWLSSYQNQYLASLNISETAQETIKLWRTLWKPRHNCIWKRIKTDFLQGQKIFHLPPELCTSTNLGRNYNNLVLQRRQTRVVWYIPAYNQYK